MNAPTQTKWNWNKLANPAAFMRVADFIHPYLVIACLLSLGVGLYYSFFASPPDYQQGETVRIMYVHVPAAYIALMAYGVMALGAASFLIFRHPLGDLLARASAPAGALFCFISLVTGSLWGKPMWGTWWVWDARLTSMLILFFLYLGYIALANGFEQAGRGAKPSAILALVGTINLPIIKFSVDWWNTLHQPATLLRMGGPKMDSTMLTPLLWMMLAFTLIYVLFVLWGLKAQFLDAKIKALSFKLASGAGE